MTVKIKLCGMSRKEDIEAADRLRPDYIGFVFAEKSRRYVSPDKAAELKKQLLPEIKAVGVFADEDPEQIAKLLNSGVIDIAQLHGSETNETIKAIRLLTKKPIIQAFRINAPEAAVQAEKSQADYILLDSGAGTGKTFNWNLIRKINRPYFLAGGLNPDNVLEAIDALNPYAVDVSSGIETEGHKDEQKMKAFVEAVRKEK